MGVLNHRKKEGRMKRKEGGREEGSKEGRHGGREGGKEAYSRTQSWPPGTFQKVSWELNWIMWEEQWEMYGKLPQGSWLGGTGWKNAASMYNLL